MLCPKCLERDFSIVESIVIKDLLIRTCFINKTIYKCICGFKILFDFERTKVENSDITMDEIKELFIS